MISGAAKLLSVITLLAWGGGLLHIYLSGRIAAFLHPDFRPFVLITGILLVALAGLFAGLVRRTDGADCDCEETGAAGHAHEVERMSPGKWAAFFILLVPLLSAMAFSADEFGARTLANRLPIEDAAMLPNRMSNEWLPLPGLDGQQDFSLVDYLERTEDGFVRIEIIDMMHGAEDPRLRDELENLPVELIGQAMPARRNNPAGDRFQLKRLFMLCCAADARPVSLIIEIDDGLEPPPGKWVRIKGTAHFIFEGGKYVPKIHATAMEPTSAPRELMLY